MFSSVGMFFAIKESRRHDYRSLGEPDLPRAVDSLPDRRSQRLGAFDGTDVVRTPRHRQRLAGWLFVPCLIRILFASYLNLYVLAANGTGF